jgi:plasmid stabilization system protein ParE
MRLRYRAQALADIDAIHGFLEKRSPAGAPSMLNAIYASIHLFAEDRLSPVSRSHQVSAIGQSHGAWKL